MLTLIKRVSFWTRPKTPTSVCIQSLIYISLTHTNQGIIYKSYAKIIVKSYGTIEFEYLVLFVVYHYPGLHRILSSAFKGSL